MRPNANKIAGVLGVIASGLVLGATLSYGNLSISQEVPIWRKVGQVIQASPSSLDLSVGSTTATALKIGQTGTRETLGVSGVCNVHSYANTIAASSTATVDCQSGTGTLAALDGIPAWASGDRVLVQQATSTPTTFLGLHILGVSASNTAGYIELKLANLTGDTFTWSETASSSWNYMFRR